MAEACDIFKGYTLNSLYNNSRCSELLSVVYISVRKISFFGALYLLYNV